MKAIKRFNVSLNNNSIDELVESDNGYWVRFSECENYVYARDHIINELEHKIKELESEKENAYQEGKLFVVNLLMGSDPENAIYALNELTITTRMGEEYEESWSIEKVFEFFNVNQSFESKITNLEDCCETMYWNALAIKERFTTDIISRDDKSLNKFIQSKINEIKAQYLEQIIKTIEDKHRTVDPMSMYEPAIDIKTLKGEVRKLRNNHE